MVKLTDEQFKLFRNLIYDNSGINFTDSNPSILESRLRERLRSASVDAIGDYYKLLSNKEELKVLLDSVTTNLTRFFRNAGHVDSFRSTVLPELIAFKQQSRQRHLRIWSAGCSTGEEPYTLGMLLLEHGSAGFTYEITASDISLTSILTAKQGFYPTDRVTGVVEPYLSAYFDKTEAGYQVNEAVRSLVRFEYSNLHNLSGFNDFDIIFCRNVLIYFDQPEQKRVVERFWDAMTPHSYLFVGHSESLFGMNTKFEFHKTPAAVVYRKFL